MSATTPLWIGTFPAAGIGTPAGLGEGVWCVDLDGTTGALGEPRLVATTPAPTFVATHRSGRWLKAAPWRRPPALSPREAIRWPSTSPSEARPSATAIRSSKVCCL